MAIDTIGGMLHPDEPAANNTIASAEYIEELSQLINKINEVIGEYNTDIPNQIALVEDLFTAHDTQSAEITAEEAARIAADGTHTTDIAALDTRIDTLEGHGAPVGHLTLSVSVPQYVMTSGDTAYSILTVSNAAGANGQIQLPDPASIGATAGFRWTFANRADRDDIISLYAMAFLAGPAHWLIAPNEALSVVAVTVGGGDPNLYWVPEWPRRANPRVIHVDDANYAVGETLYADAMVVRMDSITASRTVYLPEVGATSNYPIGGKVEVFNNNVGAYSVIVRVKDTGADTMGDGTRTQVTLDDWDSVVLVYDGGTRWLIESYTDHSSVPAS